MKSLRVVTDVYNESCQEERDLVFKDKETLMATAKFDSGKTHYVSATRFEDKTWRISIDGLTLDDISGELMLLLLQKINTETGS